MFRVPESIDDMFGEMPKRSRLISLKPMGHGTIWQESLSSLVVRIAREHTCSPLALLNREILPSTNIHHQKREGGIVSLHIKTMNGVGKYASELVRRLEQLAHQTGLQRCTFLPWANIIDPHGYGLLHPHPHWCKTCVAEWRKEGAEPYYPLMWMSAPVKFCIKHGDVLSDLCPQCGMHQPFIPKHAYLDHCSHCGSWLASHTDSPSKKNLRIDDVQCVSYQTEAICEMLVNAPDSGSAAQRHDFQNKIRETIDVHFSGSVTKFERSISFRRKLISDWLCKDVRPTISNTLLLAYRLETTLVKFISEGPGAEFTPEKRIFPPPPAYEKHKITDQKRKLIKKSLGVIVASSVSSKPMVEIAKDLGFPYPILKYHFPDECVAISNMYKQYRRQTSKNKKKAEIQLVKSLVQSHINQRLYLSNRELEKLLKPHGIVLKRPDVRKAIKEVLAASSW